MLARNGIIALALTLVPVTVVTADPLHPAAAAAPAGGNPMAYAIAGSGAQTVVDVIDTRTHSSVTTVPMGAPATAIGITPDAHLALVTLFGNVAGCLGAAQAPAAQALAAQAPRVFPGQSVSSGHIAAINIATNQRLPGLFPAIDPNPVAIAIKPDGTGAYVVNGVSSPNCVTVPGTVVPVSIGGGPSLSVGTPVTLPNSNSPVDAAVSPDGKTLWVLTSTGFLDGLALPGLTLASATGIPSGARHIVLSPDGATAYISVPPPFTEGPPLPGFILPVALGAKPAPGTAINLPTTGSSGGPSSPTSLEIATTPAGRSTLYVADPANLRVVGIPLPGGPPSALSLNSLDDNAGALFATPDGGTVEMTTPGRNLTVNITGAAKPPGALGTCFSGQVISCPPGNGPIVVTPDQAPVASFVATPAGPGQPTSFDASASTVAYGTIASYHWVFGDGSSQDTSGPTTTHSYATGGIYSVSLTETDSAGTSVSGSPPSTIFTGQTMTRRGGPEAQATRRVSIPNTPTTPVPSLTPKPGPKPPGVTPKITLDPEVGPPGTVVAVSGSGFPANTPVTLGWQPGIGTAAVTTSPTGTFDNRLVLVLPKDRLGDRQMVAQTFGATATFLAVPPSVSPGGHGGDLQFLFRR